MTKEKARIGIVGAGWWSTTAHIPGLARNRRAELVAVCDTSQVALNRVRRAFGELKTYRSLSAMLERETLDGVIVAVTHRAHYEVAKTCIERGLHVLLEKPMTLEAKHARELVELAAAKNVELIVGYPYHYTEMTLKAREILQSGLLGPIQFVSCLFASMVIEFYRGNDRAYQEVFNYPVTGPGKSYSDPKVSGGGQGHLQVTHIAGSLLFITGLEPERVSCFMANWDVPVDLVNTINCKFKSNDGSAPLSVIGSTGNLGIGDAGQMDIRVYCERGYLYLDQETGTLTVHQHDGKNQVYGPLPGRKRYPMFAPGKNLVDVILKRGKNGSPGIIGARVVELLDAAYRSARADGRVVAIDGL
ncbi:MAG: Gfo/Idh/MocA family oxidoreductase [Anaerolineae bacterium]|nr:Gfo/Idh/MocA family oxidoreductase [Anaerolineae bacterium]